MITSEQLAEVHAKKLAETGSFDQAFKHSHWRAFEAGVLAAGGQVTSKFRQQFGVEENVPQVRSIPK